MPRIPDELIDRIKDATNIVEVVSEHVKLTRRGSSNYFGLCPFHAEKTPSFSVNADRQIYHCFGCGAGGNVFGFLQEIEHISFVDAVRTLAERAGISADVAASHPDSVHLNDSLYRATELAQKFFHHMLHRDRRGRDALAYLHNRGLTDATIQHFGLGFAPPGWDNLLTVAKRRALSPSVLERAGLVQSRRSGDGHYDRFRDRITFPIAGASGRIIGFGARALRADDEPRYLNSPETPIYHKSSVLYGLHRTRNAIRQEQQALIVEGYMDLLSLYQHGFTHVVATSGTALTPEQGRLLRQTTGQVVLLFDGDAAGSAAAGRGMEVLVAAGLETRVVTLPEKDDPDSYVQTYGADALRTLIDHAQEALDCCLDRIAEQHDLRTIQGRERALETCKPLLLKTDNPVRRDLLIKEVAQRLQVDERAIRAQLHQESRQQRHPRPTRAGHQPEPAGRIAATEKEFLGLLLNHPAWIGETAARLSPEAFADPSCQRVAVVLFTRYANASQLDIARLMDEFDEDSTVQLVSECAMQGYDTSQVEQLWRDYLRHMHSQQLTREILSSRSQLQEAVAAGNEEDVLRINRRLIELTQNRQHLLSEDAS